MRSSSRDWPEAIQKTLAAALTRGEIGVQVAAYLGEELVIDAAVGVADRASGRRVDARTLFSFFSVGKALVATAVHVQAERGLIDYDAPIARYWPEFASHGKDKVTVFDVLTHRSGVPQMPDIELTAELFADWNRLVSMLAELEPIYPADSRPTYQSLSYGYLLGEVVRRTDRKGRSFRDFVKQEICDPLDIDDLYFGVPDEALPRVATVYGGLFNEPTDDVAPLRKLAFRNIRVGAEIWNQASFRRACMPAAMGIGNARSVARLFAMLANGGELNGVRLLSKWRVRSLSAPRPHPYDVDGVVGRPVWVGVGGYQLGGPHPPAHLVVGTNPNVISQAGAGGSFAWADPELGLAAAIFHNALSVNYDVLDPAKQHPFVPLADALREMARARRD